MKTRLISLFCLLLTLVTWADNGKLYTPNKLSSSLINCIVQDRRGYIWVGTEYGLNRFDGYHFTKFFHDSKDTTSLADNSVCSFLVDSKGNLWIGSSKGFMQYNYTTNSFKSYPFPPQKKVAIRPRVYSIIENHRGQILVGTAGYGLFFVDGNFMKRLDSYSARSSDEWYAHMAEDSHHVLWRGSHQSVFSSYTEKNGKVAIRDFKSPYGPACSFQQVSKDKMLIICLHGIMEYDYATRQLRKSSYQIGSNVAINASCINNNGDLLLGTIDKGIMKIPHGSSQAVSCDIQDRQHFPISATTINSIFEDRDKNLWIGCYRKGLYLMNQCTDVFHSWSFSEQDQNIGSSVASLVNGDHGIFWCAVTNNGVYGFDYNGKIVAHPSAPEGTSILYRDTKGQYWLGTNNAVYTYNPLTGNATKSFDISGLAIYSMADDGNGHLYISDYSKGLYVYNTVSHQLVVISMVHQRTHGFLCNDWIRNILIDHDGLVWLATSNGVACYNPKQDSFNTYGWNSLLSDIQINYLCEDAYDNIIIGTDEGLYLFERQYNRVKRYPHSETLGDCQISGIVRDKLGDLWVSTTSGIFQISNKQSTIQKHVNGNGLLWREYTQGAVMHTGDDLIGFGSNDGITVFRPDQIRAQRPQLGKVYLTEFTIDGKSIGLDQDEFELGYSQNTFTLEFSLLDYKNADHIAYEYRINDGDWMTTDEGINSIPFTKLQPGNYTIEVRAVNNGIMSAPTTISVHVNSPWYSSIWAWMVYALIVGTLVILFFFSYERRRKAELDEQKMRFLIDATHDIRSPLTLIISPIKKLRSRLTDNNDLHELDTIDKNAQRLLMLVNQILDERRIDKDQMQLHCRETQLLSYLNNVVSLYQNYAMDRNIRLQVKAQEPADENGKVWIDRMNFDKVINNLLSNALKYTYNDGEILLAIHFDDKYAHIFVIDSGIGFSNDNTDRLFDRFVQGRQAGQNHVEGTGIGLNLCKAIVMLHGGTIQARNRDDGKTGAVIEVKLPLGNAHLKKEQIENEEVKLKTFTQNTRHASKNYHILIVDDDPEIINYISSELHEWYYFDSARDGEEGLMKILKNKYDLVISDVKMPKMDGISLLKKIKNNANISDIPVILLTSKSEIDYRLEGFKKGADGFLAKPFEMEELRILIDNLIDNVRRLRGKYSGALQQEEKLEEVEVKTNNDALMDRVMKCVNDNISDPDFNVERLTEDVGISRAQLHRKMKEITGVSTGEFIRNIRLEQAAKLIREGGINVTQVAFAVGFSNQSHFSTIFRKHYGVSPKEYSDREYKVS